MNDLERAKQLRMEAERLEHKERVRSRLRQLIAISKDPDYDKYLAQLLKDLDSNKATPGQVEQETERSYNQYRQRMAQGMVQPKQTVRESAAVVSQRELISRQSKQDIIKSKPALQENKDAVQQNVQEPKGKKQDYEFKIGAHAFSLVGAVFVLSAFVIFGYNFLTGIWQGLCLYAAALFWVVLSELLLRKKSMTFSNVTTGIGIGGLYVANIINYLVLYTINGLVAMIVTLFIAIGTIWISKKKDSASIRIISLLGCYICFFPIEGFETALSFLVVAVMLLTINVVSIFFQNQNNQAGINVFHVCLNVVFTAIITGIAWSDGIDALYLSFYVVTSFIFINVLCLKNCRTVQNVLFPVTCAGNGICTFVLFLVCSLGPELDVSDFKLLYVQLVTEVLLLAVSVAAFLFWNKEDARRWNHVYYPALFIITATSVYNLEVIISTLLVFFVIKLLARNRQVLALDAIVTTLTAIIGLCFVPFYNWNLEVTAQNPILNSTVCLVIFMVAIMVSVLLIRNNELYLYHELLITGFMVLAVKELLGEWELAAGWFLLTEAILMFLLFMMFNHMPGLKNRWQFPYNIVCVCVMALFYICSCTQDWVFSTIMMVLGAVVILVVFRKRYYLAIPKKYLLLAGFLSFFSLAGDYGLPIVESILLMIIALSCVGVGFKHKDKVERICGLVMAMFVCIKLVLYDFREVETLYRVVVFFIVGILTLGISFIYILLEKNEEKQKVADKGTAV